MKRICILFFLLQPCFSFAQKLPSVQIIQDSINSSFRGLSVPSDNIIWVSGSNGTVGRSTDAGNTWKWMIVPGFEKKDIRDIEAFDSLTAIIMVTDNPATIFKTTDGGGNWVVELFGPEGLFLDAIDCIEESSCICIGDPIHASENDSSKKRFFMLETDRYRDWFWHAYQKDNELFHSPAASENEALFAASGSNIKVFNRSKSNVAFISGGAVSHLYIIEKTTIRKKNIPVMQGRSSSGSFSMYARNKNKFYITGGDYVEYWKDSGNVVYTANAGKTWKRSFVHGYRSCIIQSAKKTFITCGTNGVDISFDGCKTFQLIHGDGARGKDGFNVCAKSKTGKAVYFAGSGRIGKLIR
jgi:hypothetical protein